MPPAGFEATISVLERPNTDRAAAVMAHLTSSAVLLCVDLKLGPSESSLLIRSVGLEIFAHRCYNGWAGRPISTVACSKDVGSFAKGVIIVPVINGQGM
jgi:hypothetical protein